MEHGPLHTYHPCSYIYLLKNNFYDFSRYKFNTHVLSQAGNSRECIIHVANHMLQSCITLIRSCFWVSLVLGIHLGGKSLNEGKNIFLLFSAHYCTLSISLCWMRRAGDGWKFSTRTTWVIIATELPNLGNLPNQPPDELQESPSIPHCSSPMC